MILISIKNWQNGKPFINFDRPHSAMNGKTSYEQLLDKTE